MGRKKQWIPTKIILKLGGIKGLNIMIDIVWELLFAEKMAKMVSCMRAGATDDVLKNGILALAILLFGKVISVILSVFNKNVRIRETGKLKIEWLRKVFDRPLHQLREIGSGGLKERLTDDIDNVIDYYVSLIPEVLCSIVGICCLAVYMWHYSAMYTGVVLFMSLFQIIPPLATGKIFGKAYEDNAGNEEEETEFYVECTDAFLTLKVNNAEKWALERLEKIQKRCYQSGKKTILFNSIEMSLASFVTYLIKYVMYLITAVFVATGHITIETGTIGLALLPTIFSYTDTVFKALIDREVKVKAIKRITAWEGASSCKQEYRLDGGIKFTDCYCEFGGNTTLELKNFSTRDTGITVIKGRNGAGKTTALNVISGLIKPIRGCAYIGEIKSEELLGDVFPKELAYICQDKINFNITPKELFEMYEREIQEKALKNAFEFGLSEEILNKSLISRLSGGENKKVILSIILACNARVLLVDEPNNDLDSHGVEVLEKMIEERNGLTVIIDHTGRYERKANCLVCL
ncbi:MAG: ABC transporter ATP-binding protein/permease [Acetatifactor sp.]|nr:ABC transporter ATP-binding protein/permease [Acetatifactor sp.]